MHSVCLSVHALTFAIILQMSWNSYMLFTCNIAWTVLKMLCIRLLVRLRGHTKFFQYITAYGSKFFKAYNSAFIFHYMQRNKHISFSCTKTRFVYKIIHKFLIYYELCCGNGWKCILNCVSWLVSVILNFNALGNANIVQRHYTELLRSNWIFCLILRITFWNYFLTVSKEVEDHF